jgi:hypothetical protein
MLEDFFTITDNSTTTVITNMPKADPLFSQTIAEWKALRDIGILSPADTNQPEVLELALGQCESRGTR